MGLHYDVNLERKTARESQVKELRRKNSAIHTVLLYRVFNKLVLLVSGSEPTSVVQTA